MMFVNFISCGRINIMRVSRVLFQAECISGVGVKPARGACHCYRCWESHSVQHKPHIAVELTLLWDWGWGT